MSRSGQCQFQRQWWLIPSLTSLGIFARMKIRRATLVIPLAVVLLVVIGAFRARFVQHQNDEARAYMDAMTRLVSSNTAVSDFHMDLTEATLNGGGSIEFRATFASPHGETELMRVLGTRRPPFTVGGHVSFAGDTNGHWLSINWDEK